MGLSAPLSLVGPRFDGHGPHGRAAVRTEGPGGWTESHDGPKAGAELCSRPPAIAFWGNGHWVGGGVRRIKAGF